MHSEKIREFILRRPFSPFDIKMSDGRLYTVDHPEFVALNREGNTVYFSTSDGRDVYLDAHHITTLETANRPAAA